MRKNNVSRIFAGSNAVTVIMVLVVASGLGGCANSDSTNKFNKSALDESNYESASASIEVSAKEAIELACADAESFIPEPLVQIMNSTDDYKESSKPYIHSGADGKRLVWNVSLGNRERTKQMEYRIENGVPTIERQIDVTGEELAGLLSTGTFTGDDVNVDSTEAVKMAIEQKGLLPGDPDKPENWLIGYHFTIARVYVSESSSDTRLAIVVDGISPNGNLSHVTIDQESMAILGATEQIGYDEDGHSLWNAY